MEILDSEDTLPFKPQLLYCEMLLKDPEVIEHLFTNQNIVEYLFKSKMVMQHLFSSTHIKEKIGRETTLVDTDEGKQLGYKGNLPLDYRLELVNDLVKDQRLNQQACTLSGKAYSMSDLIKSHNYDTNRRYRVLMMKYMPRKGYSSTYKMLIDDMYDGANYLIWSNYTVSS